MNGSHSDTPALPRRVCKVYTGFGRPLLVDDVASGNRNSLVRCSIEDIFPDMLTPVNVDEMVMMTSDDVVI